MMTAASIDWYTSNSTIRKKKVIIKLEHENTLHHITVAQITWLN